MLSLQVDYMVVSIYEHTFTHLLISSHTLFHASFHTPFVILFFHLIGKWYYEVELCVYASDETEQAYDRDISVGWATPLFQVPSDQRKTKSFGIGDDEEGQSWAYDLLHLNACHGGEK